MRFIAALLPLLVLALNTGCVALGLSDPDPCLVLYNGGDDRVERVNVVVGTKEQMLDASGQDPLELNGGELADCLVYLLSEDGRRRVTFAESFGRPDNWRSSRTWLEPVYGATQRGVVRHRARTARNPTGRALIVDIDADWIKREGAGEVRAVVGSRAESGTWSVEVWSGEALVATPVQKFVADGLGLKPRER